MPSFDGDCRYFSAYVLYEYSIFLENTCNDIGLLFPVLLDMRSAFDAFEHFLLMLDLNGQKTGQLMGNSYLVTWIVPT